MEISFSYGLNSDMVKHMLIKYIFSISDFVLNEHTFYPDENEILKSEIFQNMFYLKNRNFIFLRIERRQGKTTRI
jgi:hypothetical protein